MVQYGYLEHLEQKNEQIAQGYCPRILPILLCRRRRGNGGFCWVRGGVGRDVSTMHIK